MKYSFKFYYDVIKSRERRNLKQNKIKNGGIIFLLFFSLFIFETKYESFNKRSLRWRRGNGKEREKITAFCIIGYIGFAENK